MQYAIGPLGVSMIPASVREEFTEPVLCATFVPGGKSRGTFNLSSQAYRLSIICLQAFSLTSFLSCSISHSLTMSRALVLPKPNCLLRSFAIDVSARKTFELIFVSGQPSRSMHAFVGGRPSLSSTRLVAVL